MRQIAKSPTKPKVTTEPVIDGGSPEAKLQKWFPDLASQPEVFANLMRFHAELLQVNRTMNVVPAQTLKNAEAVHFADNIHACRLIAKAVVVGKPLVDGGGSNCFTGLIFAILFPKQKVMFADRDSRRLEFPKHIATTLGLNNVSFEVKGLDDLPSASVWNLVSRTSTPLVKAMLGARKVVAQGGRLFHIKSDSWATELSSVPSQLFSFWSPSLVGQYRVPETSSDLAVVQTEKIAE